MRKYTIALAALAIMMLSSPAISGDHSFDLEVKAGNRVITIGADKSKITSIVWDRFGRIIGLTIDKDAKEGIGVDVLIPPRTERKIEKALRDAEKRLGIKIGVISDKR